MTSISDKDIIEAKNILGDIAKDWTDEQLKDELVKIKYLTETWLDEFERKTFDGETLAEIIPGYNVHQIVDELKGENK